MSTDAALVDMIKTGPLSAMVIGFSQSAVPLQSMPDLFHREPNATARDDLLEPGKQDLGTCGAGAFDLIENPQQSVAGYMFCFCQAS